MPQHCCLPGLLTTGEWGGTFWHTTNLPCLLFLGIGVPAGHDTGIAFPVLCTGSRPVVLNMWVVTPYPFHRGHLRPLENVDIYIIIHNSRKLQYKIAVKFYGGHHNLRNYVKGHGIRS